MCIELKLDLKKERYIFTMLKICITDLSFVILREIKWFAYYTYVYNSVALLRDVLNCKDKQIFIKLEI